MKIIDFEDIRKAAEGMDPVEWFNWVDYALRRKSDFQMPPKPRMSQNDGDYYNVMPAMYESEGLATVKMIGRHCLKESETAPRSVMMGDMMVYEAGTGVLKALMDAEYITTLRTGVVAAHSAVLFARKDFTAIALLGLGNIMTVCFKTFMAKLRSEGDNRRLTVKLYRHHGQEERFAEKFAYLTNVEFQFCDSYAEVMTGSDIIISAVTRATENFASDECYKEGVTVIPVCTMGFQNCDLFFDKVFTDEIEQIRGFKYFDKFRSLANVSEVLNGVKDGRTSDSERILVYNYGIGIHDLYFGKKFCDLIEGRSIEYRYCKEKYFM